MAEEMKFNHEAESVVDAIPGVDMKKINDIGQKMTHNCCRFSEYAEFIHENISDPTTLYLITRLVLDGLQAMGKIKRDEPEAPEAK